MRRFAELRWLLGASRGVGGRITLSLLLGAATVASGVTLLATASYVISAAALGTSLLLLTLPIYVVRLSGLARAACRYGERLVSHDATFRILARVRVRFYERLEPLAPARLMERRSGDLLSRITGDVDELQNLYLRGLHPLLVAALTTLLAGGFLYLFSPSLALVAVAMLAGAGIGVPLLVRALSRGWVGGSSRSSPSCVAVSWTAFRVSGISSPPVERAIRGGGWKSSTASSEPYNGAAP